ncbi:MAG: hypothetical protein RL518_1416 [Pseudomonadota bacterium]|jgi:hypothetical protein
MTSITLSFVTVRSTVELHKTLFFHPCLAAEVVSHRGTTGSSQTGSFRWSYGVKALALLLIRHAIRCELRKEGDPEDLSLALIAGYSNSLAASLDCAMTKKPRWLREMFGATPQGALLYKLTLKRMNPDRSRPGPVRIFIPDTDLKVVIQVDGQPLEGLSALRKLEMLLDCKQSVSIMRGWSEASRTTGGIP